MKGAVMPYTHASVSPASPARCLIQAAYSLDSYEPAPAVREHDGHLLDRRNAAAALLRIRRSATHVLYGRNEHADILFIIKSHRYARVA